MKFHEGMTKEKFFIEWFGLHGREVGTKKEGFRRRFIDNPMDFLDHIEMCRIEHEEDEYCRPCWTTVLIYEGYNRPVAIDRIFLDFDDDSRYCPKCKKYFKKKSPAIKKMKKLGLEHAHVKCKVDTIIKPRKQDVANDVIRFVKHIQQGIPLIVETYKGYHVHLFADGIYKIDRKIIKKVFDHIKRKFTQDLKLKFCDLTSKKDIKRFARVPLTPHEKTGELCRIMKIVERFDDEGKFRGHKLIEDKVRSLESYYKSFPSINEEVIRNSMRWVIERGMKKHPEGEVERQRSGQRNNNGYQGIIRPCFQERVDAGYMPHNMRLAFLIEAYFSGSTTHEQLAEPFKSWGDYIADETNYQVNYFLENKPDKFPPYRCISIYKKKWCLGKKCRKFEKNVKGKI